ncbi:MucBP domain-containing protein [Lactococcus garvieae]|uniref:MucBP domain-containing protein n=1 Tax=Lactococcus garvieae TaxID=1363 RepID=UPI00254C41E5|nr:MucBP domain-containing protein [Lactococcus garvieae]
MRKATTVLMTSTLILSSIYPSAVHATENTIDNGVQNKNIEVQQIPDNVENTASTNLDAGSNISPEETNNEEVDTNSSSIKEENVEQESLSNVPATSETNHASEQIPEPETGAVENNDIYASGTLLTSDWYITNEGVLHIGAGEISTVGTGTSGPWGNYSSKIVKIVFDGPVTVNDNMDWLFNRLDKVTEIEHLDFLDTSGATRMRYTFKGMTSLESLDVSTFDTSNVWIMDGMFDGTGVEILDLTAFDTRNVTSMQSLVMSSPNLKKIDVSSFDINSVTTMWSTFAYCPLLEEIDLGSIDFTNESMVGGDILYSSPIKKLTVSESARLNEKVSLNTPPTNETYTGRWQTVGSGTDQFPKGEWSGTTEELYERTQEGIADTYVWQPVLAQAEDVTIKYLDEDNNPIADDIVKTGSVGEDYTSEQKEIPGYTFKEVQGNPTGQFSDQAQTVIYIYTKDEITPITGSVIVKYEDEKGNTLSDSVIKSGAVGENYTTEKKDIKGYFFKETRGKISGVFSDETQIVTYVYSKDNSESIDKDNEKNNTDNRNNGLDIKGSEEEATNENSQISEESITQTVNTLANKKDTSKENSQALPQAGGKSSIIPLVAGITLIALGLYTAVIRLKARK